MLHCPDRVVPGYFAMPRTGEEEILMKYAQLRKHSGFALCMLTLVLAISGAAFASCGDSMQAMAAASAIRIPFQTTLPYQIPKNAPASNSNAVMSSIVGMWHTNFEVNGQSIQEAYQIWNLGGTEVHNPNVDPRSNNVCLGTWSAIGTRTFLLFHRVWWYDTTGDWLGTIHLREIVTVSADGNSHTGSFTLDFYDQNNNFQNEVAGDVVAEKVISD